MNKFKPGDKVEDKGLREEAWAQTVFEYGPPLGIVTEVRDTGVYMVMTMFGLHRKQESELVEWKGTEEQYEQQVAVHKQREEARQEILDAYDKADI